MTTKTIYSTGTITFTNGSAAIVGVGTVMTSWVVGDPLKGPDGAWYEIATITDDTHATLDRNYAGTTAPGASYQLFELSPDRNATRSLSSQFSTIATILRTAFNFTGNDQVANFNKVSATDNVGVKLQSANADKFRWGMFGDATTARWQWLNGLTWTDALTIDATAGAVAAPGGLAATSLTGTIASARLAGAYTGITGLGTLTGLNVNGIGQGTSAICNVRYNSASGSGLEISTNNSSTAGGLVNLVNSAGAVVAALNWGASQASITATGIWRFSGSLSLTGGAASTSVSTGDLTTTGGAGIGGALYVGGNVTAAGVAVAGATAAAQFNTRDSGSNWVVYNSVGVLRLYIASDLYTFSSTQMAVNPTTNSTAYNNGALVIAGGLGLAKDAYFNGALSVAGRLALGGALRTASYNGKHQFFCDLNAQSCLEIVDTSTGTAGLLIGFTYNNSSAVGGISTNGTSVTYGTSSDATLKFDPRPFDGAAIIDALKIYDFGWKGTDKRSHGVFAQEAFAVYPDAIVPGDGDKRKWLADYSKFVPALLRDAQQTHDKLAALQSRLDALESRIH